VSKVSVFDLEQIWSWSNPKIAWLQLRLQQKASCSLAPAPTPWFLWKIN